MCLSGFSGLLVLYLVFELVPMVVAFLEIIFQTQIIRRSSLSLSSLFRLSLAFLFLQFIMFLHHTPPRVGLGGEEGKGVFTLGPNFFFCTSSKKNDLIFVRKKLKIRAQKHLSYCRHM